MSAPPPPAGSDAQHAARRRALPAVITALVCVHAAMACTRVTASLLILQQGGPVWMVGSLLSLFAVAPLPLSLWAGRQADRHGLHRPLAQGVVLGCAGAGLAALSHHPLALALAALATGGATAIAAVAVQREAGQLAERPSDLKRVFGWVALGPALSNAVSPVAVGLLIDHVGFRAGFALAAVLPLLAWGAARQVPVPPGGRTAAAAPSGGAWALWQRRPLRRLLLVNLALSACWDAHSFAVPVLGHARLMSASAIGLVLGAFAVAATLVRLLISGGFERLDEGHALRGAMAVATACCALYAWLPGTGGMLLGSALLGLALGAVQPMILAMLHQVTPADQHGQALGLRMLVVNAATVLMPTTFGLLASATVPAAPLWLMGSLVLLAQWPARRVGR